jgi:hypothetical protein
MAAESQGGRFVHRSVVYASAQQCAEAIARRAVAGIDRGERVVVLAEPTVESEVRRELGHMVGRIAFRPHEWLRERLPLEILADAFGPDAGRREWPRLNMLAQQPRHDPTEDAYWVRAEAIANATLADRSVDLTCFVDADSGDDNIGNARRTHPTLGSNNGDRPSPDFDPELSRLMRDARHDPSTNGYYLIGGVLELDLADPASARGWLIAAAREAGLSASLIDEMVIVVGEAVMTTWEASEGRSADGDGDATSGVQVYLWTRPDGAVCEVIGPVVFDPADIASEAAQAETESSDERLHWLRMACLVCPSVEVSITPRTDAPGSKIRVRVS